MTLYPRLQDTGWTEPAALGVVLVAPPGTGKTPIIKAALAPLRELDRERRRTFEAQHRAWALLQKARPAARGQAATSPPGPEPILARVLIDDVTLEKQVRVHADNPHGLLRAQDEFTGMLGSLGAYKRVADADRGLFLRLLDGGDVSVDRVGAGSVYAPNAVMGVLAGTQPEKIRALARGLGDDGFLQRLLFVLDEAGGGIGVDEVADATAEAAYADVLRALACTPMNNTPIRMSRAAHDAVWIALGGIEALAHVPGASNAWREHVAKWRKTLPRLVLIYHAIEHCGGLFGMVPHGVEVAESTAQQAIRFAKHMVRHSLRFYETYYVSDEAASVARWVAGHILTKPGQRTWARHELGDARKELREAHVLLKALRALEIAAWVKPEGVHKNDGGPARWVVNPQVHVRFRDRAERETAERAEARRRIAQAADARRVLSSGDLR